MKKDKRKPIGEYHLEIDHSFQHSVVLVHKNGDTWSDTVRAMSHLMKEILRLELELQKPV